jgi:putative DNA primase/helicase
MSAAEIAAVLGDACREGVRWRCRCPLHGGLSLMLPDGDAGRLLVTCWGGCDRLDVLAEIRRRWLLDLIDYGRGGAQSTFDLKRGDEARRIARACETWHAALPALSSPIARSPAAALPCRLRQPCVGRRALGTMQQNANCPPCSVSSNTPSAASWESTVPTCSGTEVRKRIFHETGRSGRSAQSVGGGAIRLGMPLPGEWFAVAEGIETVLSVMTACAVSGWAALSAGGLRGLILPPEASHVLVCADDDHSGVGQRAAHDAAARWLAEGRRVRLAVPPHARTD